MVIMRSGAVAVVAAAVVLSSLFILGCGSGATGAASREALEFSGVTLDGAKISLSEYRGKPLVLAFMASW